MFGSQLVKGVTAGKMKNKVEWVVKEIIERKRMREKITNMENERTRRTTILPNRGTEWKNEWGENEEGKLMSKAREWLRWLIADKGEITNKSFDVINFREWREIMARWCISLIVKVSKWVAWKRGRRKRQEGFESKKKKKKKEREREQGKQGKEDEGKGEGMRRGRRWRMLRERRRKRWWG